MTQLAIFNSVNKFVENINEKFDNVKSAVLYFEKDEAFRNQYDRICVRPVFITLKKETKNINLTNQRIVDIFNGNLVVSFNESSFKKLPKEKDLICELVIKFDGKLFREMVFYETDILICSNKKSIDLIRKQEISQELAHDDEEIVLEE